MTKTSIGFATAMIALGMLVPAALAQQDTQDKPLGDAAREQQEIHKQQKNTEKTFTNADVVPAQAKEDSKDAKASAPSKAQLDADSKASKPAGAEPKAAETAKDVNKDDKPQGTPRNWHSVLDRPKDTRRNVIVVPVGTEIKVDVAEGKVVVPVRVGFATPIPALSQVAIQVNRVYHDPGYGTYVASSVDAYAVDYVTITAITVRGVTYLVRTNAVPVYGSGVAGVSPHEAVFILSAPLAIER